MAEIFEDDLESQRRLLDKWDDPKNIVIQPVIEQVMKVSKMMSS